MSVDVVNTWLLLVHRTRPTEHQLIIVLKKMTAERCVNDVVFHNRLSFPGC